MGNGPGSAAAVKEDMATSAIPPAHKPDSLSIFPLPGSPASTALSALASLTNPFFQTALLLLIAAGMLFAYRVMTEAPVPPLHYPIDRAALASRRRRPHTPARRRRPRLGDSMSSLEKFPPASAERVSAGLWNFNADGNDAGLVEEVVNGEKDSRSNVGGAGECDGGIFDMTRSLERELGDEQGALAALYLELEKERSAAATAADEAMSMMLRLQKEKAEIEMEARQYQRMTEEKSAYDKEEMEILKEIIVSREREKHVLEKEIEMYKQTLDSREQFEQDFDIKHSIFEEKKGTLNDSSDNPMMMLRQIYKYIEKKEVSDGFGMESFSAVNSSGVSSYHGNSIMDCVVAGKHTELLNIGDEFKQDIGESSMLTTQIKQSSNILNFSHADESSLCNLNSPFEDEYNKDILDLNVRDEGDGGIRIEMSVPDNDLFRIESCVLDQRDSKSFLPETESRIHGVHIINNGQFFQVEENSKQNDDKFFHVEENGKQNAIPLQASSCTNFNEMEPHIQRSCSEITNRTGQKCSLSTRGSFLDLKRSSLPSIESEKFKLGNEVERLRKRLKIIRQGREKLNLSTDHKEKECFQLQLLDEIVCQLEQIKKVSESTKSFRQASLPPLLPKEKLLVDLTERGSRAPSNWGS
ncbi:uncharacterized protein LOC110021882 [Phalaenopsis equestris]|uniref:uncharacterized protein LOC110021882 n=1 Tax=Phalaenopsis equestris TaxID=78828 RepID=UPI0009E61570|nr:uncharacterized protein LOC110021882 [Phalaenopsis equestris]